MNKPLQKELWEKIQNFKLDEPASIFPFSKKLQQENNWTYAFTTKAIEEYRKFIFLCCISPKGASPSDTVDKVWHLHLTYTQNYWVSFCRNTLHKDIHHYPSKGGSDENDKHNNWYRETLNVYETVFGYKALETIWPQPGIVVENISEAIYEKKYFTQVVAGFLIFTFLHIIVTNLFKTNGPDFLLYYAILSVAGLLISLLLQRNKAVRLQTIVTENFPSTFTNFQVARFVYGKHRAYQLALVDLLKNGVIDVSGNDYKLNNKEDTGLKEDNPLLPALNNTIHAGSLFTYKNGLSFMDAEKVAHEGFNKLLLLSKKIDFQKFILPGIVLSIGFLRILQGLANYKPVSFLVLEIGVFSFIGLMIAQQYSYTNLVFKMADKIWREQNEDGRGPDVLNNFSILGTIAIAGFAEYAVLTNTFNFYSPRETSAMNSGGSGSCGSGGSCSSGSSCGGSSCGGGCGGCGSS
ncbi:MAG: hypothetical protein H7334_03550 [Ferruginibacter sp.]|nr:hypothetical protein [Ferruginibacter sp.]